MASKYDHAIASEIIQSFGARPELLVQILKAFMARYTHISEDAVRHIADELNLSRAEVHGVVNFYHDFRTRPVGRTVVALGDGFAEFFQRHTDHLGVLTRQSRGGCVEGAAEVI